MSTQLRDVGENVEVSTVVAEGSRRKMARTPVLIPKRDTEAIRAEVIRQAEAARVVAGVKQP